MGIELSDSVVGKGVMNKKFNMGINFPEKSFPGGECYREIIPR